ncbi:hypothetical protein BH10PSE7_BH10PSE7_38740 [soil metagenome]
MSKRPDKIAKAQATHDAAMTIIEQQKAQQDKKSARLKTLREAQERDAPAPPAKKRPKTE